MQLLKRQIPKCVIAAELDPLAAELWPPFQPAALGKAYSTFGMLPLGKLHIWVVSNWEFVVGDVALLPLVKYLTWAVVQSLFTDTINHEKPWFSRLT